MRYIGNPRTKGQLFPMQTTKEATALGYLIIVTKARCILIHENFIQVQLQGQRYYNVKRFQPPSWKTLVTAKKDLLYYGVRNHGIMLFQRVFFLSIVTK